MEKLIENLTMNAKREGIEKIVVGAIIFDNSAQMLFLKRNTTDFMGDTLELPSGTVESNENLMDALIREVKEETGLEVLNISKYIDSFDYLSKSGKKTRQFNFLVNVKLANPILTEHSSYSWLRKSNVMDHAEISPEVKQTITAYFQDNKAYEKSCGAIVFHEGKILAVRQVTGFTGLPKGHAEIGETEIETAKREIEEETGVVAFINPEFRYVEEYQKNDDVMKEVIFFTGEAIDVSNIMNQEVSYKR